MEAVLRLLNVNMCNITCIDVNTSKLERTTKNKLQGNTSHY